MRCCTFAIFFFSVVATALADGEWPAFRGPTGDGMATCNNVVTKWSETENIRWKAAIHGRGWSSPVVWGKQIWVTTATEDGKKLSAICLDRATGKVERDFVVFEVEKPQFRHAFNSYASPTPAIEAGRVYLHYGSPGTACVDTATGKPLWERRDLPCDHFRGSGSSPIIVGGLLILTFDGFDHQYVAALNKQTGETVWKQDRSIAYTTTDGDFKKAYSTPAILKSDGHTQVICPAAEATIAYDVSSGKEVWRVIHGGMNVSTRPVLGHGLAYLTSGHTAHLLAVKQGGTGDLTKEGVAWKVTRGVPTRSSLILLGDHLFMVTDKGVASCVDAKTGNQLWQERIGGAFSASPVCAGGKVYFADEEGKTTVVAAKPKYEVIAVNSLDQGCMGSPAVVDDILFLRTKTHLYAIGK